MTPIEAILDPFIIIGSAFLGASMGYWLDRRYGDKPIIHVDCPKTTEKKKKVAKKIK